MPRKASEVPQFRVHKPTGQGYVNLNGRRKYLGRADAREAKQRYARLIAEWEAGGRQPVDKPADLTIVEVIDRFWTHVETYYRRPDGTLSNEPHNFTCALRPVKELYGDTTAASFGPLSLKAVRERMIGFGWCRSQVNKHVRRVRHLFKWGTENELIPPSVFHALQAVAGLRRGRCGARESKPVQPVPDANVEKTLEHCTPTLAAMIRLQLLTGMRPGEVCMMRTTDINTSGKVWTFTPPEHKTAHVGRSRTVYLGRKAQAVLKPFLRTDLQGFIFSPMQAEVERRERMHAERVTPLSCGNKPGSNVKRCPKKAPGDRYETSAYGHAIAFACERAWPVPVGLNTKIAKAWRQEHRWHPNQLRHSFATRVRREYGLEAAQVLLGHAAADVTQVYAERDESKAVGVALKIG